MKQQLLIVTIVGLLAACGKPVSVIPQSSTFQTPTGTSLSGSSGTTTQTAIPASQLNPGSNPQLVNSLFQGSYPQTGYVADPNLYNQIYSSFNYNNNVRFTGTYQSSSPNVVRIVDYIYGVMIGTVNNNGYRSFIVYIKDSQNGMQQNGSMQTGTMQAVQYNQANNTACFYRGTYTAQANSSSWGSVDATISYQIRSDSNVAACAPTFTGSLRRVSM